MLMPWQGFKWLICCALVLQIIKFQSSPAKVHMLVDNSHKTPWEMTFESTRVGGCSPACWNQPFRLMAYQAALVSFRNATPSASCSCWWGPDTPIWVNLTWSLCSSALGIWVERPLHLITATSLKWRLSLNYPNVSSSFDDTGGSSPPRSLQTWVTCSGLGHTPDESIAFLPHDIYALGTQENPQGEKEWTEHIRATLRSHTHIDFKLVSLYF